MGKVYYKVTLAHARSDEHGKGTGGKAGDQKQNTDNTKGELLFEDWYLSGNGWDTVLRCKNTYCSELMVEDACKAVRNKRIGYDMDERYTLYDNVKPYGFDCGATTKDVECDCSTLMTTCANYAGFAIPRDTRTANMKSRYSATKAFKILEDNKHTKKPDYLDRGDILVRAGYHTAIVVNTLYHFQHNLKDGSVGDDVKALQCRLNQLGVVEEPLVIDGEFGRKTDAAVRAFQKEVELETDGIVGRDTATRLGFLYC